MGENDLGNRHNSLLLQAFILSARSVRSCSVIQVAKYFPGVGESENGLVRVLGGMSGAGVIARIVRGYTFISRHFKPGDKIVRSVSAAVRTRHVRLAASSHRRACSMLPLWTSKTRN